MNVVGEVAEAIFGGVWDLLMNTEFPGVGVSLGGMAVALVLIRFSIRIVGFLTGFHSGGDYGGADDGAHKIKAEYDRRHRNKIGFE